MPFLGPGYFQRALRGPNRQQILCPSEFFCDKLSGIKDRSQRLCSAFEHSEPLLLHPPTPLSGNGVGVIWGNSGLCVSWDVSSCPDAGTPLGGHGDLAARGPCHGCIMVCGSRHPLFGLSWLIPSVFYASVSEQTYCDRLVQDMPFLTGLGRLSEQQVDRIILQLNRYYPQILSNKDAEKVPRNLRLLSHPFPLWAGRSGGQDSLEVKTCLLRVTLGPEHQLFEP